MTAAVMQMAEKKVWAHQGQRQAQQSTAALGTITHQQSTTRRDAAIFAHYSDCIDQFNEVVGAIGRSPDLVELGQDGRGEDRFTTREMIEAKQRLHRAAEMMAERERHEVSERDREAALTRTEQRGLALSGRRPDALTHVTDGGDLGGGHRRAFQERPEGAQYHQSVKAIDRPRTEGTRGSRHVAGVYARSDALIEG